MAICEKCVMPVQAGEKLCEECRAFHPISVHWDSQKLEFDRIVDQYRGAGEKYDFVIPFTGGIDSSYALFYMVKEAGARVLAYTWDSGMISDDAWKNINNVVQSLGVDHHVAGWDADKLRRLYRATFKRFGRVCFYSIYLTFKVLEDAIKMKIPLIVTGFSAGQRRLKHNFEIPSQNLQREKINVFLTLWSQFFGMALDEFEQEHSEEIQHHLLGPLKTIVDNDREVFFTPVMVPFSNYIVYSSRSKIGALLESQVRWTKTSDLFSHSCCNFGQVHGYIEHKRNMTDRASEISWFVRNGAISRKQGLEECKKLCLDGSIPENLTDFYHFLGISETEFNRFVAYERLVPEFLKEWAENFKKQILATVPWVMGCDREIQGSEEEGA